MASVPTDPTYASSQDFAFTPTPSPLPAQKAAYNTFNTDFTNFLGGQETIPQLQDRYANRYNIPYLQETAQRQNEAATQVGDQIRALPASVASSSANSMLTQGQKDRIVQSQQAPLMTSYNGLASDANDTSTRLGTAETNLNTAVSGEQAQQMKMTQPWLQKYDATTIQNAAENTQWTQDNQWEFNKLLANQNAGITLSEGDQARLNQLAVQEDAFNNQLDLLDKQNSYALELWG